MNPMSDRPNFIPMQKWILAFTCNSALGIFFFGHRVMDYLQGRGFYPEIIGENDKLFWLVYAFFYIAMVLGLRYFIGKMENYISAGNVNRDGNLARIGHISVINAVKLASILLVGGCFLIWFDPGLLNPWDILFIAVFIGIFYVGLYFHFYFGIQLKMWRTDNIEIEMEKLKIEYDEQRMWLRTFLWLTASILVSQVFVALKLKFEPYFTDSGLPQEVEWMMAVNAIQIVFLIFAMWTLVFSQIIRRMEEVKLELKILGSKPIKSSTVNN